MMSHILKNPTILIVEDDLLLLKAYGIKFKKEGLDTVLLSDAPKTLARLGKAPPNAVLLGLSTPETSGIEILEAIRKNSAWKNVPVFILTTSDQKAVCVRAEKLGAIECIVKADTGINDVIERIKNILYLRPQESTN